MTQENTGQKRMAIENEEYFELLKAFEEQPLDVKNIIKAYIEEGSVAKLAKRYNVSPSVAGRVLKEAREAVIDRYEALQLI